MLIIRTITYTLEPMNVRDLKHQSNSKYSYNSRFGDDDDSTQGSRIRRLGRRTARSGGDGWRRSTGRRR